MRAHGAIALVVFLLAACGADYGAGGEAPAAAAVVKPSFGQRCDPKLGCKDGLTCLDSDYAPHPWCTTACPSSQVKNYCDPASVGGAQAFCVQMPASFQGPSTPLCLPICANLAACTALDSQWEQCAKPKYKELPLITDLPTKVCLAPSAHGQVQVDPQLCDWQDKVTDPVQVAAKPVCLAACKGILKACQLGAKERSEACCGWDCWQYVTPGGTLDEQRLSTVKCLNKSFAANQSAPTVCTAWQEDCGPLPATLAGD